MWVVDGSSSVTQKYFDDGKAVMADVSSRCILKFSMVINTVPLLGPAQRHNSNRNSNEIQI